MDFKEVDRLIKNQEADLSLMLKNLSTGQVLYERNTRLKMRSASIIKLFILSMCAEAFENKSLKPDQILNVPKQERVSFSLLTDLNQTSWRLDDMATLMIILSDNTATNLLIDLLQMDEINDHIRKLGAEETVLQRKMMDRVASRQGLENYTSLRDAGQLLENVFQNSRHGHVYSAWMLDVLYKQRDRTMLSRYLPERVKLAHKTGLNEEIQHDIGLFKSGQDTYLLGVFMQGQPDEIKGLECIGKIAKHMYEEVTNA